MAESAPESAPDGVMDMDEWTTHYDEKQKANYYHNAKTGEVRIVSLDGMMV